MFSLWTLLNPIWIFRGRANVWEWQFGRNRVAEALIQRRNDFFCSKYCHLYAHRQRDTGHSTLAWGRGTSHRITEQEIHRIVSDSYWLNQFATLLSTLHPHPPFQTHRLYFYFRLQISHRKSSSRRSSPTNSQISSFGLQRLTRRFWISWTRSKAKIFASEQSRIVQANQNMTTRDNSKCFSLSSTFLQWSPWSMILYLSYTSNVSLCKIRWYRGLRATPIHNNIIHLLTFSFDIR